MQFGASNKQMIDPFKAQQVLSQWFTGRQARTITFKEETDPKNDPNEDYFVAYEAVFEPDSLDQTRVAVWVTMEGYVAIGLETHERIAKRLGVNCYKVGFAAGHEPTNITEEGLVAILDLIADGKILITPFVIPLLGLISSKAKVRIDVLEDLILRGYSHVRWLKTVSHKDLIDAKHLLEFRPWS